MKQVAPTFRILFIAAGMLLFALASLRSTQAQVSPPPAEAVGALTTQLNQADPPTEFDHFIYLSAVFNSPPSFADQVIIEVNVQRTANGCAPLVKNDLLTQAAQRHSENMALNDFFDHIDPDGRDARDRVEALGYQAASVAENIASGQETPAEVMADWMSSPGHRENILDCAKTEIGVGYYYLENDTGVEDNQHYWTQVFARPF